MLTPIELIKTTIDGMAERGFGRIINITSSAVKAPIDVLGLSNGARGDRWFKTARLEQALALWLAEVMAAQGIVVHGDVAVPAGSRVPVERG